MCHEQSGRSARGALASSITVPSSAGQDRGAGVLTGEAKRTRTSRNPNEPERRGLRMSQSVVKSERTRASRRHNGEGISAEVIDPRAPSSRLVSTPWSRRCAAPIASSWCTRAGSSPAGVAWRSELTHDAGSNCCTAPKSNVTIARTELLS